jgi:hypothetical protein
MSHRIVLFGLIAGLLVLAGCARQSGTDRFTTRQLEVYNAMQAWSQAAAEHDTDTMWNMLSRDAQRYYHAELTGPFGPRARAATLREALGEDSLLPEDDPERQRIERDLAKLPDDIATMTSAEYYAWQLRAHPTLGDQLRTEAVEAQFRLWHHDNVEGIVIEENRATVHLRHGDPRRDYWVSEGGEWKRDLPPTRRQELEAARDKKS